MSNFNKPANRWNYYERRADETYNKEKYGIVGKAHNYGIADIDFKSPKPVIDAISDRAKKGTYSYCYISGLTLNAIKIWYEKQHDLKIERDWIKVVHGTINAMYQVVQALTNENDYVLIQTPIYNPFAEAITFNNRKIAENKLIENNKTYEIDFKDFEEQIINKKIKLFMFCNPHNPSSVVWHKNIIQKIVEICAKHNVLIFSDEVHSDLTFKPFTSILKFDYENVVLANSPNKAFNLGGLKASYLIIKNEKIKKNIDKQYQKNAITSIHDFVNPAFQACFLNHESYLWLQELKEHLWHNYLYFKDRLEKLGFKVFDLDSTYLPWVKVPNKILVERLVQELKKQKIIICTAQDFYHAENNFLRINIATSKNELAYLINSLKTIINSW